MRKNGYWQRKGKEQSEGKGAYKMKGTYHPQPLLNPAYRLQECKGHREDPIHVDGVTGRGRTVGAEVHNAITWHRIGGGAGWRVEGAGRQAGTA